MSCLFKYRVLAEYIQSNKLMADVTTADWFLRVIGIQRSFYFWTSLHNMTFVKSQDEIVMDLMTAWGAWDLHAMHSAGTPNLWIRTAGGKIQKDRGPLLRRYVEKGCYVGRDLGWKREGREDRYDHKKCRGCQSKNYEQLRWQHTLTHQRRAVRNYSQR